MVNLGFLRAECSPQGLEAGLGGIQAPSLSSLVSEPIALGLSAEVLHRGQRGQRGESGKISRMGKARAKSHFDTPVNSGESVQGIYVQQRSPRHPDYSQRRYICQKASLCVYVCWGLWEQYPEEAPSSCSPTFKGTCLHEDTKPQESLVSHK